MRTFTISYHGKINQDEIYKEDEAKKFHNLVKKLTCSELR